MNNYQAAAAAAAQGFGPPTSPHSSRGAFPAASSPGPGPMDLYSSSDYVQAASPQPQGAFPAMAVSRAPGINYSPGPLIPAAFTNGYHWAASLLGAEIKVVEAFGVRRGRMVARGATTAIQVEVPRDLMLARWTSLDDFYESSSNVPRLPSPTQLSCDSFFNFPPNIQLNMWKFIVYVCIYICCIHI